MPQQTNAIYISFIIVVTGFLQYFLFNIWWEDSELMVAHLLNGNLLGFAYGNLYYMENYGLQKVYVWLQNITNWYFFYPALLCAYVVISVWLILYTFLQIEAIKKQKRLIQILIVIIWAVILLQTHLVQLQFTRVSYLMCVVGLGLYYFYSNNKIHQGFGLLWFSTGFFTRMESGLVVWLLLSVIYLMYTIKIKSWQCSVVTLLFPLLVISVGIGSMLNEIHFDTHYYNLIEPDIEYKILERGDVEPLAENASEKEEAIFEAAQQWLLSDSATISPAYLRSIVKENTATILPLEKVQQSLYEYILEYPALLIAFLAQLILIFLWAVKHKINYSIYIYIGLFTLLLCLPIFTVKTTARIIEPYIVLGMLLWYAYWYKQFVNKKWLQASLGLLLITCAVLIYQNKIHSQQHHMNWQQKAACYETYKELSKEYKVAGLGGLDLMHAPAFYQIPFRFKWLPLDMAQLSYTPEGAAFISKSFPCHRYDITCRYKYLQQQAAHTLILAEPARIATMQYYLEKVYEIKLFVEPLAVSCNGSNASKFYTIQP